jgi:hypothetical protein
VWLPSRPWEAQHIQVRCRILVLHPGLNYAACSSVQRLCIEGLSSFHFIMLTNFGYVTALHSQATRLPLMAAAMFTIVRCKTPCILRSICLHHCPL